MPLAFCLLAAIAIADTYPSETYPADAEMLLLSGTTDQQTGLAYIARGANPSSTPSVIVQLYRQTQRSAAILDAINQGRAVDEGGLSYGAFPCDYLYGGTRLHFAGATGQAAVDDDVNYVWIDAASNGLAAGTNGFPSDVTAHLPLAKITTSSGDITAIDDERGAVLFALPGGTFCPHFYLAGTLSVKTYELEYVAPVDFTLISATGRVNTAPVGSLVRADILVNGTSIFDGPLEKIKIEDGTYQGTSAVKNHAVTAGDVITFEVQAVGSTTPGSDLTIVLNGRTS